MVDIALLFQFLIVYCIITRQLSHVLLYMLILNSSYTTKYSMCCLSFHYILSSSHSTFHSFFHSVVFDFIFFSFLTLFSLFFLHFNSTGPVSGMARVWDYLSGSALLRNFNLRVHKFTFQVASGPIFCHSLPLCLSLSLCLFITLSHTLFLNISK
jgi:hypothetical protein